MFGFCLFDAVVVLCLLIWIFRTHRQMRRIPGPTLYPIIGNLPDVVKVRRGIFEYLKEGRDKYGPIFRLSLLNTNFVFISDPDTIKSVLTSSENLARPSFITKIFERWTGKGLNSSTGAEWHSHRKLLDPMFSTLKIKVFVPSIVERCEQMCNRLQNFEGQEIDLSLALRDLTLKLAYDNVFNMRFDESKHKEIGDDGAELMYLMLLRSTKPWLWKDFFYSFTTNASREEYLIKKLRGISLQAISTKKEKNYEKSSDKSPTSFLDYLVECQKEDSNLTDEEIRTHLDTLIISVLNAIPIATSWVLYFVASNNSVQDKVRGEINLIFPQQLSSKRLPTMEELSRLRYLECVINESFRLSTPPPALVRVIAREISIGKYTIPAGTNVFIDWNAIHHDGKYYSTPNEFNPEHFYNAEEVKRRPLYAFVPFGRSYRVCIAEKYARMVMKLVVASVVQNFQIESTQSIDALTKSQLRALIKPNDNAKNIFIKLKKKITLT